MRPMGRVARVEGRKDAYSVLWGILRERHHFEDLSVHGRIILKWILRTGLISLRIVIVGRVL
jgi:hypothetical protein